MIIKILLTIVFFAVMIGVGVYSRKQASSVDGFVLGGRAVGPWLTAFAYGTSYFSAVVFVGYAGQFGWRYGLSSAWIGIGNAIIGSLLAWLILGRRTKLMTQHIESRTMPDFFGTRFNDQGLRVVASVIAFVFLIPYTAGVYSGISRLLFEMGFDIPYEYCVIIMSILTAIYVIIGGYKATAMNDFIQGIIMLFGITAVILAVLNAQGGLTAAVEKLAQIPSDADHRRERHQAWHRHLHHFCVYRGWRLLFPRWFRTSLRARHWCQWQDSLRLHRASHAGHAARRAHSPRGVAGTFCLYVNPGLAGAHLQFHHDARPHLSRQEVAARRSGRRNHR